jgi:hypothetical protein
MDEGLNGFHCDAAAFFWTKNKSKIYANIIIFAYSA